jgi:arsenite methyltransferase
MPRIEAGGSRGNTSAQRLDGVADECAGVVTTRAVLAYVANKAAAARQFHRVLKPEGGISIADPIYQDEALRLAALTDFLLSRPAALSNAAGFVEIQLELHIDIVKAMPVQWETFIDIAPLRATPTLRELFSSHFSIHSANS